MTNADMRIGARLCCRDGNCGRLRRVVLDPHSRRVTDLIVERGFLLTTSWVLPADLVREVNDDEIHLDLCGNALDRYPAYRSQEFEKLAPDDERDVYAPDDTLRWRRRYGVDSRRDLVPMVRWNMEGVAVERGMPVRHGQEIIAWVDHLLIDAKRDKVSEVVLARDDMPYCSIVPAAWIEYVDRGGVWMSLDKTNVDALPHCRCRDKDQVSAELRHHLAVSGLDLSRIEASLEDGIVSLRGVAPSLSAKRRAEAAARSIEGVMRVENELDTSQAAAVRVRHALLSDPRTDLSAIEVEQREKAIVLRGGVDSTRIREAAVEIALKQSGALAVVDSLQVEPDGDGALLRARSISG